VPIGAEETSSGYDIAFKDSSTNLYTVWATDSSGNFTAKIIGAVSGSGTALEALETTFHQDLNGDGTIGVPSVTIESYGSTSLVEVGSNYDLDSISSGTGPALKYLGVPVAAGQYGTDVPIGAEQTSSGYDIAFKDSSTNLYTVWSTDSNGNFTAKIIGAVSANSAALEALETTFKQDLNGDHVIGIPAGSGSHAAQSISTMMGGSGNDNFVFRADLGVAPAITNADKFESHEPPSAGDTGITGLSYDAHDHWQTIQSTFDGPDPPGDHHHAAAASVHIADLHANHFIIH
jgi:microcompartment protein CcmL/EutN